MEKVDKGIPSQTFWSGRKVLLTGHTGFKGIWMSHWLKFLGAEVMGLSYSGYESTVLCKPPSLVMAEIDHDILSRDWQEKVVDFAPEIVFHLAAQSLVYSGFLNPVKTFETNTVGSLHVLELLEKVPSIKTVVITTTDKVYKINRGDKPRVESDPIGGSDPYSASKGTVELMAHAWPLGSNQKIFTVRSGNVIGGGDASPKRLLPDLVRAWKVDQPVTLRSPFGIRPWLHVLEPIRGYLVLAERANQLPLSREAFNFAPSTNDHVNVGSIADRAYNVLPKRGDFNVIQSSTEEFPETLELLLDASKARDLLDWKPVWTWKTAVDRTLEWYVDFYDGKNPESLFQRDLEAHITDFENGSRL
jgi:CDP-glucose 4,6-dehydratase